MIAVINLVLGTVLFLYFMQTEFIGEYSVLIGAILGNLLCVSMTLLGSAGVNLALYDMRVARSSIKTELYTSLHTPSRFRGKLFISLAAISLTYVVIILSSPVNNTLVTGAGVLSVSLAGIGSVYTGYRELKDNRILDMNLHGVIGLISMIPMLVFILALMFEDLMDLSIIASGAAFVIIAGSSILCKLSARYFHHISRL